MKRMLQDARPGLWLSLAAAALALDYAESAALFAPLCTKVHPITTAESFGDLQG